MRTFVSSDGTIFYNISMSRTNKRKLKSPGKKTGQELFYNLQYVKGQTGSDTLPTPLPQGQKLTENCQDQIEGEMHIAWLRRLYPKAGY